MIPLQPLQAPCLYKNCLQQCKPGVLSRCMCDSCCCLNVCQVMLRVTDLDRSIKFYTEALGMTLIRTRDNPDNKYKLAFLGRVPRL